MCWPRLKSLFDETSWIGLVLLSKASGDRISPKPGIVFLSLVSVVIAVIR